MRQLLFAIAIIVPAAGPSLANERQHCSQGQEPQLTIKGCSEIIRREPNDATAYHNRAVAHAQSGNVEQAIVDYSKTIEITPNNAAAYENRGRAYASKGDYALALADVTKASELVKAAAAAAPASQAAAQPKPLQSNAAAVGAAPPKSGPRPPTNGYVPQRAYGIGWPPWFSIN
jgi:tetratricopeptide (TPR) repeat protein